MASTLRIAAGPLLRYRLRTGLTVGGASRLGIAAVICTASLGAAGTERVRRPKTRPRSSRPCRTSPCARYNTDPTSPTFYPAGEEPTGRNFAPAVGPGCFGLNPGDCAPDMLFNGPWYSEWDFKFTKRFPFGRKGSVDFNVEVFNAFNTTNFTPVLNPGGGANVFRITNQQSGARIGQLVWR
jgi:hypothetical protein